MLPVIPTLTVDGWDTNPVSQMSKLWEYYQAADYSQSNLFRGRVTSLKYTLQTQVQPELLAKAIEADIENLYGEYFDTVAPLVDVKYIEGDIVNINIDINTTRDTNTFKLSRAIKGRKSGVIEFETKLMKKYEYDIEF
jgi:hypothetical protein